MKHLNSETVPCFLRQSGADVQWAGEQSLGRGPSHTSPVLSVGPIPSRQQQQRQSLPGSGRPGSGRTIRARPQRRLRGRTDQQQRRRVRGRVASSRVRVGASHVACRLLNQNRVMLNFMVTNKSLKLVSRGVEQFRVCQYVEKNSC